ncbi:unnamed protein product [Cuscuta campestris]|uniref:No apical meristem-associated C-terminal domain-containing protein n=1 Tax=Cuscuta campestris TaxID=132261 RepID=A0A484LZ13_9ASTE|nr:unnamed protein product [Cuscuta campestris]
MGVYEECSRSRRSGTNDADVLRLATTRYQDDGNQGKVPIDLWKILSRSPKWQQLNNPDGGSLRKRSTVAAEVEVDETIGSTDQIPPFNVADSDDEDPIPRPIERKKAKSIASASGGSASVSASPRDEIGRAMIEQLWTFNLQEQERLKLKEKELKLKEQEAEMKVDETIGSTDQIPPFNVADSDDEDPIPRPIGRKKAKSIASGSGGSASVSASPRDEIGRAMIEQLRAFNLQEQERLKLKEKELKLKEQEAEMKVMQTDPGTLSEFGRIIYEQRMREIKEKYNLP